MGLMAQVDRVEFEVAVVKRMAQPGSHGRRMTVRGCLVIMVFSLAACGADLSGGNAGQARTQLNDELQHASAIGLPAATLTQLQQQRTAIDQQRGWFGISDATAASRYQTVLVTTQQAERDAQTQSYKLAQVQLDTLNTVIVTQHATNFQPQLTSLRNKLSSAITPKMANDIITAATQDQDAIDAMAPAQSAINQLSGLISQMRTAGLPTDLAQIELSAAQQSFAAALTADDFHTIAANVQADQVALANDEAQAIPFMANSLAQSLSDRLSRLQAYGESITAYQPALTLAQTRLPSVHTVDGFTSFAQQITDALNTTALPLARGQAKYDVAQLQSLLTTTQQRTIMAYEYQGDWGLPDVEQQLADAHTLADFRSTDDEAMMLVTNLNAMIANVNDGTPYNQPHATDANLLHYYHATQGKTLVISLREQTLRAYQDGKLVMAIYVTTGRPELPSPPGFTHVTERLSPTVFSSDAPKGSAFYYNPTFINYALLYHDGGYFIHDAWWRLQFGPGSNLPHYDPDAFNGGSHGCVNLPLQSMAQVYAWTPLGTPVIVY